MRKSTSFKPNDLHGFTDSRQVRLAFSFHQHLFKRSPRKPTVEHLYYSLEYSQKTVDTRVLARCVDESVQRTIFFLKTYSKIVFFVIYSLSLL